VRSRFTFTWQYVSYGVPEQLREISAQFFQEEREKAVVAMSEACTEIQQVMRASLLELVNHLHERLYDQQDGKPQRLRESTVEKLRDFLATFDMRNVVDDQELKEQVEKARALLEGVSTDALRNMPLVRAHVREGMADLAAQMDVLAGDRISRKFRFDEA
jgi:serine phosphatase RsbU (regulator of sigma subunit)